MLKYPSIGNNTNQHQQKKRQYFMQWDSIHTHTHILSLSLSSALEVRGTHHTLKPEWAPAMPTISWEVWVVFLSPKWLPRL